MKLSSYHICIEGTIGVGKTSLAKLIAEEMEAKTIFEEFEENPFLSNFYSDKDRYAMQTQLFFLLSRYKQQQELQQVDMFTKAIISDYMFDKDRLFAALNLNDIELDLYNRIANELQKNIVYPDLIIFLQSDTDRLMYNIKIRGRNFEKNIDLVEPLGTETQIFIKLNNKEIISRMYNQREIKIGQKIEFSINLNKIHIFDKDTEKVIK